MFFHSFSFFFVVCCLSSVCLSSRITSLPGISPDDISFAQYSGYINLDAKTNKSMFYWFVESENPRKDPMIIWLQGGPGCSGLIGFFEEHGPFLIESDGNLSLNPYRWNKLANIVYVESPVGVGFSYSDDPSDYRTNDNQTASDNYQFLLGFFEEFPQFLSNPFWITGESYGGVYGPMLANLILEGSNQQLAQNFQGFALGNPVTSCPELKVHVLNLSINMYYWNGILPLSSLRRWNAAGCDKSSELHGCYELYSNITDAIGPFKSDDLYYNFCTQNGTLDFFQQVPNCVGLSDRTSIYLNRKDVQEAIYAEPTLWTACGNPELDYHMQGQNMMKYYEKFFQIAPHLHIMIYSGDIDIATVPHAYTQLCVESLNRPLVKSWKRWTVPGPHIPAAPSDLQNITAGYVEVYDRLTFATVKGAGHEVPTYQPITAYNMFERFIVKKMKDLGAY